MKKTLIVYYSWSNGNTKSIAEKLRQALGADSAEIKTVEPYPKDYDVAVEQRKREVEGGFQPAIQPLSANCSDYELIVVGSPTWWYSMAPAVLTFLKSNDFSGKTVAPFITNAGWPGRAIQNMKNACPGAEIRCEKEIRFDSNGGNVRETSDSELSRWIEEVEKLVEPT